MSNNEDSGEWSNFCENKSYNSLSSTGSSNSIKRRLENLNEFSCSKNQKMQNNSMKYVYISDEKNIITEEIKEFIKYDCDIKLIKPLRIPFEQILRIIKEKYFRSERIIEPCFTIDTWISIGVEIDEYLKTTEDFKRAGYKLTDLCCAGYRLDKLLAIGYSADEIFSHGLQGGLTTFDNNIFKSNSSDTESDDYDYIDYSSISGSNLDDLDVNRVNI